MGAPRIDMVVSVPLMPDPKSLDREQALYMAKLAEQAERYEDMVKYMKQIVDLGFKANELSVEERNLLSVGYKNMMSVRRTAWRTVQQLCDGGDADESNPVYRDTIAKEVFELITEVCDDVVKRYVEGENKAEEKDVEVHVFFKKMEGDYNRYGAEITEGDVKEKSRRPPRRPTRRPRRRRRTCPRRTQSGSAWLSTSLSSTTRSATLGPRPRSSPRTLLTLQSITWTPWRTTSTRIRRSSCNFSRII